MRVESDRYESMPSHQPVEANLPFMVWDYFANGAIAFCGTMEDADRIADALNATTKVKWSTSEKSWIGED